VDLTKLNESKKRHKHDLSSVDQTLGRQAGTKVFTKLDANYVFWQISFSSSSEEFTMFVTPFWRYCFRRLPFGITSAPEYFQKRMNIMLDGLPGVLCMMDDIIIFGNSRDEHDARVKAVLKRLEENVVILNFGKCYIAKLSVSYLDNVI